MDRACETHHHCGEHPASLAAHSATRVTLPAIGNPHAELLERSQNKAQRADYGGAARSFRDTAETGRNNRADHLRHQDLVRTRNDVPAINRARLLLDRAAPSGDRPSVE